MKEIISIQVDCYKSTCLYFQEVYIMAVNIALQLYEYSQPFTYIVWYGLLDPV